MRLQHLPLMTLLVVGASTPALAQVTPPSPSVVQLVSGRTASVTPDAVLARLMSFDRNGDGRIVAEELPERMHNLLTRGDRSSDGALDRTEARQLALAPSQLPVRPGFQAGVYGFGDSGFDTSQRIQDALDDLRLAARTKERAVDIARKFQDETDAKASEMLYAELGHVLTAEQMADFRSAMGGRWVSVTAIRRDGVMIFGATREEAAGQEHVTLRLRDSPSTDPAREIEGYQLDAARRAQALDAVRAFKAHTPGRLNEAEQAALVEQLRSILSDEQRDDLRAALGRRPVVRLAGNSAVSVERVLQELRQQNAEPATFQAQDLPLRK